MGLRMGIGIFERWSRTGHHLASFPGRTSAIERLTIVMNGRDCLMMQFGLLFSCDSVLKFDWFCQLSDSGSNSLNSHKLPGPFSYTAWERGWPSLNPFCFSETFSEKMHRCTYNLVRYCCYGKLSTMLLATLI